MLKAFVAGMIKDDHSKFSAQERKLERAVRHWLEQRNLRTNTFNVCKALEILPTSPWKGTKWSTLRDMITRAKGYRSRRTDRERMRAALEQIATELKSAVGGGSEFDS